MRKKFYILATIAITAILNLSCSNDDDNNNGNEPAEVKVRIASFTASDEDESWADIYNYTYNADGKVVKIAREDLDGVVNREYAFAYSGSTITITRDDKDDSDPYTFLTITLGSHGYASTMADEWDEYAYTYNADGYMTQIDRNGSLRSTITIVDNCISTWTRFQSDAWQTKDHTYSAEDNVAHIHNIYSEQFGSSRWLMETGLFGKASVKLCSSNQWQHSEIASILTYELDNNKCVTKETKNYDGWKEYYSYTWEVLP
jgi:YD repeat-containing protein